MESKDVQVIKPYQEDDEIDLFELFSSLAHQWRWVVGITVIGMLLSITIALLIPKQYEVSTQVAEPNAADVAAVITRGYGKQTTKSLFAEYYQDLNSAEELHQFIKAGGWLKKLYPEKANGASEAEMFSSLSDNLSITVLAPIKEKGAANNPAPDLLAITLWSKDEQVAANFLNNYVTKSNSRVLEKLRLNGQLSRDFEVERIQSEIKLLQNNALKERGLAIQRMEETNQTGVKVLLQKISLLRDKAKQVRLLDIKKREEKNREKIKKLSQSIDLLLKKSTIDEQSKLEVLNEALALALEMNIKSPTTIEMMAKSGSTVSETEINVTTKVRSDLFLMGTDYIQAKIKNLQSRTHKELFIKSIAEIKKQIAEVRADTALAALKMRKSDDPYIVELPSLKKQIKEAQSDVKLVALKARKSDDPYITELPALLKKLDKLQALTFGFPGAKLYRLDKKASADGKAEKPKRALIVAVGSVLAFFVAVFVALIMGAVKRRKEA